MHKTFILLCFQLVFAGMHCFGQHNGQANMYLTNYLISKDTPIIGNVALPTGKIKSIAVKGDHSGAFKINKDHQLVVQPNKLQKGVSWYDITLIAKTSSGNVTKIFRIVKNDFIRNKVIAHRGAWKNTGATENSISALKHAVRLGCEGSEFDVHMSADSLPVINHDPLIQGVSIAKTNSAELLQMKLANRESLPTLENYLKSGMEQTKTKLILEIKPSELGTESSIALTRKIVTMVEKLHGQAWVDYISFDYDVCKEVMKLAPYAKVAYLKGDKAPAELAADNFFGLDYNYNVLQKNREWLAEAKNKNLTINVWTVNERTMMEEFLQENVDFITTNEPELLLGLIK